MAVRNYANDIRDEHHRDPTGIGCLRAIANHRMGEITAREQLSRIGKEMPSDDYMGKSTREQVVMRGNLRDCINALVAHMRADPKNLTDDGCEAVECLRAKHDVVNRQITMDATAAKHMAGHGADSSGSWESSELRDQGGNRIGTMLSNADLRDAGKIAAKLKTDRSSSSEAMNLGEFFRGVAGMRTSDGVRNVLTEGTDSAGGYAVPSVLMPGILNALVPASALLQAGANVAILDQQADSFRIAATDTIPTAAWRLESGNVAESDPAFRAITITPRSLAFRFKISRELLQDAPGLETALRTAIAQAFAKELDRAGLRGTGTAPEIRGLLNIVGVNAVNMALPNGAALTNYSKLINASRLIKEANAPAPNTAIVSTREDETIALFADTTGQPLRRPDALADWKFLTSSQIPVNLTVGTSTDCSEIYVGDFGMFSYFIREGISVQLLNELYAATGEVGFVCHTRVDVAAMYPKAFAVITGVRA